MQNQTSPNVGKLTDEQIERLVLAIKDYQVSNLMARVIWTALEKATDIEARRKILVSSFSQAYELLVVMQMAINSDVKPAAFDASLRDLKRQTHARSN